MIFTAANYRMKIKEIKNAFVIKQKYRVFGLEMSTYFNA